MRCSVILANKEVRCRIFLIRKAYVCVGVRTAIYTRRFAVPTFHTSWALSAISRRVVGVIMYAEEVVIANFAPAHPWPGICRPAHRTSCTALQCPCIIWIHFRELIVSFHPTVKLDMCSEFGSDWGKSVRIFYAPLF